MNSVSLASELETKVVRNLMWGRLSFVDFEDGGSHIARTVGTV